MSKEQDFSIFHEALHKGTPFCPANAMGRHFDNKSTATAGRVFTPDARGAKKGIERYAHPVRPFG